MSFELHDDINRIERKRRPAMNTPDLQLIQAIHDERVRRLSPRVASDIRWRRRPGSMSGTDANGMPREHGSR